MLCFFFSSRRRHTRLQGDWSSDVCSSDLSARRISTGMVICPLRVTTVRCEAIGENLRPSTGQRVLPRMPWYYARSIGTRSEERRVGKECRSQQEQRHYKKTRSAQDTDSGI